MKELKTIVVGVDFSEASKSALREADRIAMWEGGALHLTHVIPYNEAESLVRISEPSKELVASVESELTLFSSIVGTLSDHKENHVMVGHPFHQMMKIIEEVEADLLVIGSQGAAKGHSVIGAVASKCIRRSPVPVLVVRKQQQEAFAHVVVCLDFSETSLKALDYAAQIADDDDGELHLLHIASDPWALYTLPTMGPDQSRLQNHLGAAKEAAEKKIKELAAKVRKEHPGLGVSTKVMSTVGVTQGIVDFINTRKMDLAVLGTHGQSKFRKFFIGSTTERLAQLCPSSFLTVSPDQTK